MLRMVFETGPFGLIALSPQLPTNRKAQQSIRFVTPAVLITLTTSGASSTVIQTRGHKLPLTTCVRVVNTGLPVEKEIKKRFNLKHHWF